MSNRRLIKFISFNILWLVTATWALSSYLSIVTVIAVALYILEFLKSNFRVRVLAGFIFLLGVAFDVLAQHTDWVQFTGPSFLILPQWLISLWILFAWLAPDLIYQFSSRRWLLVALSMVAGPLSYYAGEGFGVVKFLGVNSWLAYAAFWGALMYASHRWVTGGDYGTKK